MTTDPRVVADFLAALTDDEYRAFTREARTPFATDVAARDVVELGYCSPSCMLALEGSGCRCRCEGRFHGVLADVPVAMPDASRPKVAPVTAAPAYACDICDCVIGKAKMHYVLTGATAEVICGRCIHGRIGGVKQSRGGQRLHAELWPGCPIAWHDIWDHQPAMASRAAVRFMLPNRRAAR